MPKKPIFIISTEGKSEEEIEKETDAAYEKFVEALKKSGVTQKREEHK